MSESPESVFQRLVDAARELCRAGSAGISIRESGPDSDVFRWRATSGEYAPYRNETMPRFFSPCGTVLDRNSCLLMADPVRFFPYIDKLCSPVREVLLIPFYDGQTAIGTVWVVAHDAQTYFDAEDARVITSLTKFASAAVSSLNQIRAAEKAEDEIREVRAQIESTLIAGEIGTWVFNVEANRIRGDRNLARMFGVNEADASGAPLESYISAIHPDERSRVSELLKKALESGSSFEAEYRLIGTVGEVNWVVARGTVERDAAGRAVRLPGVVVDITERKRAEEELRASEDRRRLALDAAELGTWNIDAATNTLTSDERFRLIFHNSAGPLSYEEAFGRIHPEDVQRIRAGVAAATRPSDPTPYVAEYRVIHPNGAIRWVFARGRARFMGEGAKRRLTSFDGTVLDITDRKKLEDELRRIAAELSEADHRKNEFLAMLAHELRNPLAPIRNALEVIRLSADNERVVRSATEMMNRQVDQMVRLVDDLLDVSRLTSGKIDLRLERIDIATAIRQAIENSRPMIQSADHHVTLELPDRPIHVVADAMRLAQVFSNLLNNSCKYSEPHGRIRLSASQQGDEVVVSVQDAGVGIDPTMLPKVFELFTQVDQSLERSQGGLGIGLSLVRSLVGLHGGSVVARSEGPGRGSEFLVRLPVAVTKAVPDDDAARAPPTGMRSVRILVVDDNYDSATSLAMLLKLKRNETRTAHDGEEAIRTASDFRPDVVLLDIGLPKLNGYEVARRVRAELWGQQMILIALTGWGQEDDRRKAKEAGFDGHLVKPVDQAHLTALLSELMSRRQVSQGA
ncbi:MAG TPA: PAS domain-containing protein [Pirellulales bacterium]